MGDVIDMQEARERREPLPELPPLPWATPWERYGSCVIEMDEAGLDVVAILRATATGFAKIRRSRR
jgi:hypothetical protein